MMLFFIILLTVSLAIFALQKAIELKPPKKPNLKPLLPVIKNESATESTALAQIKPRQTTVAPTILSQPAISKTELPDSKADSSLEPPTNLPI